MEVEALHTMTLVQSLLFSPLLVGDVEGSRVFDRSVLEDSPEYPVLNYAQKLGHIYEDALAWLLEKSPRVDLVAQSVQIFNDNRITLGELDYIVRVGERVVHLELAVKFYLVREAENGFEYPGPDPKDNWLNKLKRLETHQLKMGRNEFAKKKLLEDFGVEKMDVEHLIYGRLFDHIASTEKPFPRGMQEGGQRSLWLYRSEWDEYFSGLQDVVVIPKHLWPVSSEYITEELLNSIGSVSKNDLIEEVVNTERCVMFWSGQHKLPVFLAPDHWPEWR